MCVWFWPNPGELRQARLRERLLACCKLDGHGRGGAARGEAQEREAGDGGSDAADDPAVHGRARGLGHERGGLVAAEVGIHLLGLGLAHVAAGHRVAAASQEVAALRRVFGNHAPNVCITNTKCYTGHVMGASVEDVAAVVALETQRAPAMHTEGVIDGAFDDLTFCDGSYREFEFAIHVALGMGSHVAVVVYRRS